MTTGQFLEPQVSLTEIVLKGTKFHSKILLQKTQIENFWRTTA